MTTTSPTPDAILQTAFGFWNSKVLLTAVTFDLFTVLGQGRLTGAEIGKKLDLHPRGVADFLDALVAMKFLERDGDGVDSKYFNMSATALYLDRNSPRYIGGIPEMLNARLFKYWNDLPEALRTGKPQNETKHGDFAVWDQRDRSNYIHRHLGGSARSRNPRQLRPGASRDEGRPANRVTRTVEAFGASV